MFQAFQQAGNQETGVFKEGGKLAYGVKKFQSGGVTTKKDRKDGVRGTVEKTVYPSGAQKIDITRNNTTQYTPFNMAHTQIDISAPDVNGQRDTTGFIWTETNNGLDDMGQIMTAKTYHTPAAVAKRKAEHPIASKLFPWAVFPKNVLPTAVKLGALEK